MIQCEAVELFVPGSDDDASYSDGAPSVDLLSILLPPRMIALLAALSHGNCATTQLAEGQWTVCNDGFSLLEREKPLVAMVLGTRPDETSLARAGRNAPAASKNIDPPVKDSDCGRYRCSAYLEDEYDPEREAHVLSLPDRERARLGARVKAWKEQEIMRDLEEARASNTALHERLAEFAAHETELEREESAKRPEQKTLAQVSTDSMRKVKSDE